MGVFIDSGYIIALANKTDIYHKKAIEVSELIKDGELGSIYTSNYIFDEVVTHIMARQSHETAVKAGNALLNSEIGMLEVTQSQFIESWQLFKKKQNMSFTDCTTVKLMEENNIKNIVTFDKGFKQFKPINVLG